MVLVCSLLHRFLKGVETLTLKRVSFFPVQRASPFSPPGGMPPFGGAAGNPFGAAGFGAAAPGGFGASMPGGFGAPPGGFQSPAVDVPSTPAAPQEDSRKGDKFKMNAAESTKAAPQASGSMDVVVRIIRTSIPNDIHSFMQACLQTEQGLLAY